MMHEKLSSRNGICTTWGYLDIHFNVSSFFQNLVIITFTALFTSYAYAKIIEKPENGTHRVGTDILLTCLVKEAMGTIIWEDVEKNTDIFIGKQKNTNKEKYRNFLISKMQGNYSLIIKDATKSDEGVYSCNERDTSYIAKVTIEVPPNLTLSNTSSSAGGKPVDTSIVWKFLGAWTLLILVSSLPVVFLVWTRHRNYPRKCNRYIATNNKGVSTTEPRICYSVSRNKDMTSEETMVNETVLTYGIPNTQSICIDVDSKISGRDNKITYATVITNTTSEERL